MYDVKRTTLNEADLMDQLLPQLRDRVFHVRTQEAWPCIEASGRILSSPPDCVPQYDNAGLRHIGHVSVCDLRSLEEEDLQLAMDAYYSLDFRKESRGPVFLFLTESAIEDLAPYHELSDRINSLAPSATVNSGSTWRSVAMRRRPSGCTGRLSTGSDTVTPTPF